MSDTNLSRLVTDVEVLASTNRPARYSSLSAHSSCAIVCARARSCCLLAWACSTDEQMNLRIEKAGARYGIGAKDKHWWMISIVKKRIDL